MKQSESAAREQWIEDAEREIKAYLAGAAAGAEIGQWRNRSHYRASLRRTNAKGETG